MLDSVTEQQAKKQMAASQNNQKTFTDHLKSKHSADKEGTPTTASLHQASASTSMPPSASSLQRDRKGPREKKGAERDSFGDRRGGRGTVTNKDDAAGDKA